LSKGDRRKEQAEPCLFSLEVVFLNDVDSGGAYINSLPCRE